VFFNGQPPQRYFYKLVLPDLITAGISLYYDLLPSSSGSYRYPKDLKVEQWRIIQAALKNGKKK